MQKYMTEKSKILIVDDKVENLVAFKKILEDVDAEVITKTNGNDALKTLLNYSFALIILDVMMPVMDGFEFIEELKKNPEHRPIPIVVVTAKDLTSADRLRLNGGIEKLIEKKSLIQEDLLEEIRQTLESHTS